MMYSKSEMLPAVEKKMNGTENYFGSKYMKKKKTLVYGVNANIPYEGVIHTKNTGFMMIADLTWKKVPEDDRDELLNLINNINMNMIRGKFIISDEGQLFFENFITFNEGQTMDIDDFMIEITLASKMALKNKKDIDAILDRMDGEFTIKEE